MPNLKSGACEAQALLRFVLVSPFEPFTILAVGLFSAGYALIEASTHMVNLYLIASAFQ